MQLTRDQIFAARNTWPRETVPAPELGGELTIRVLTLGQAERLRKAQADDPKNPVRLYPLIAVESLCDAQGLPLFTDADAAAVDSIPFPLLERVAFAALKLNGMVAGGDGDEGGPKN